MCTSKKYFLMDHHCNSVQIDWIAQKSLNLLNFLQSVVSWVLNVIQKLFSDISNKAFDSWKMKKKE